jgi:peptidyl-prolyl cis-trans isomerase SurA
MLAVAAMAAGAAWGQVKVPRYQSPIAAPAPQMTMPATTAITTNGTVVEDAIVRVNDQIIDRSDYMRAETELQEEARQSNLSADELAERQKDMLRDMIDQHLLLSGRDPQAEQDGLDRGPGEGGARVRLVG